MIMMSFSVDSYVVHWRARGQQTWETRSILVPPVDRPTTEKVTMMTMTLTMMIMTLTMMTIAKTITQTIHVQCVLTKKYETEEVICPSSDVGAEPDNKC